MLKTTTIGFYYLINMIHLYLKLIDVIEINKLLKQIVFIAEANLQFRFTYS